MRITTKSAIDISESLASFLLASHLHHARDCDPVFEKRLKYVDTAKYTIADVYMPNKDIAFEVKSVEHGTSALKSVIQSSIYLEQVDKSLIVMQKPRRRNLAKAIEGFASKHGVGVIWIVGIPTICSENTIKRATGGCVKPFELWRQSRYSSTKKAIIAKSKSGWSDEYVNTLEQVIQEEQNQIFEYSIQPEDADKPFSDLYWS